MLSFVNFKFVLYLKIHSFSINKSTYSWKQIKNNISTFYKTIII